MGNWDFSDVFIHSSGAFAARVSPLREHQKVILNILDERFVSNFGLLSNNKHASPS